MQVEAEMLLQDNYDLVNSPCFDRNWCWCCPDYTCGVYPWLVVVVVVAAAAAVVVVVVVDLWLWVV